MDLETIQHTGTTSACIELDRIWYATEECTRY